MNIIGNKKKLTVIGGGTAGAITALQLYNTHTKEVVWYRDPSSKTQSVGEASTLGIPTLLHYGLKFHYKDLPKIEGTSKRGIRKINWGHQSSKDFIHGFDLHTTALHFSAVKFQNYIYNSLKPYIKIIESPSLNLAEIDSDYIFDCTGKPKEYSDFVMSQAIPVNSAYVVNCFWDKPKYDYSFHIARPYGWVFCIPLQKRMSVGYMYNSNISSLEEVKKDINNIFEQLNLTPSTEITEWNFKNYFRKENFTNRVCYNGNSSFFLEPLESTSTGFMIDINQIALNLLDKNISLSQANKSYHSIITDLQEMITMHYFSGSSFDTPFWQNAISISENFLQKSFKNSNFKSFYKQIQSFKNSNHLGIAFNQPVHAQWGINNWDQNLKGLNLYNKLNKLINI